LPKNFELTLANSQTVAIWLGFAVGDGDWRDLFLSRDEIAKVTPAEVLRVAKGYLKSSNRTLGEFIPTADRRTAPEIPATPDDAVRFKDYKGGRIGAGGRSFRSDTEEHRGARDSRNAAERHEAGDVPEEDARGDGERGGERALWRPRNRCSANRLLGRWAGALLERGTKTKNKPADSGRSRPPEGAGKRLRLVPLALRAMLKTVAANLPEALKLVRELLRESTFPETEFEQARLQRIQEDESNRTEPNALASIEMQPPY